MKKHRFWMLGKSKREHRRAPVENVSFEILSMPGDRILNEDFVGFEENGGRYLFALADGLGGHGGGEIASNIVIRSALEVFRENPELPAEELLARGFQTGQDELLCAQNELRDKEAMKSTMVLLLLEKDQATWGHIGDSRLYYFKGDTPPTRTLDHSVTQMLALSGQIREKDIRGHEDRNRLLRVLGIEWEESRYEIAPNPTEIYSDDAFLLCSDGFWEHITERQMRESLAASRSAGDWVQSMHQIVCKNGRGKNMDNFSAIAVVLQ